MVSLFLTTFCFTDGFANRRTAEPNFNLVNKDSLDKILKAEVFVNSDGQLRVAHLILRYTLISSSFQASKCVIRIRDPRLHRISAAAPGFLLPSPKVEIEEITTPIPKGILTVGAFSLQQTISAAISSYPPSIQEEEVVEITDFEDEFEVFNRVLSPKALNLDLGPPFSPIIDKIGIQRKPKSSLLDLIESQPGRDVLGKAA